jgi:ABC-2 type transport system permease protein
MLKRILLHEWRNLAAESTLLLVAAIFVITFGYGVYNGVRWLRFQERTIEAATAEESQRMEEVERELVALEAGAKPRAPWLDPRAPSVFGGGVGSRNAVLNPSRLAALSIGQSDLLPYYYTVSIWSNDQTLLQNGEIENPLNLLAGRFDVTFVVVYLLPLLILALSYNVLSAEKEQGTLAMTLVQPVTLRAVVGGKILFRALLVVTLAVAITLAGALIGGVDLDSANTILRLLLWSGVVLTYALFWFGLAVAVNAAGRSSAANATTLAGCWLLLVVLLPSFLNLTASVLHPLPSRVELIGAQREASNEAVAQRTAVLVRYYEDHPEMARGTALDTTNMAARGYAAQEEVNRRMRTVLDRYDRQLEAQRALVRRYRFLSPALLAQDALNDIAGTGDARFRRFQADVARFAEEWKAFFVPRVFAQTRTRPGDTALTPRFEFHDESEVDVVRRVLVSLSALALLLAVVVVPGVRALRRYPVIG